MYEKVVPTSVSSEVSETLSNPEMSAAIGEVP